jgi:hypothetical protein
LYFTTDYEGKDPEQNFDVDTFAAVKMRLGDNRFHVSLQLYKDGYTEAEDNGGRKLRIGKVLNMLINKADSEEKKEYLKDLLQKYNQDPMRLQGQMTKKKKLIVMSTANYDIAGMTQGRSWQQDSCMRLDSGYGQGATYVHCDILFGTIVAYLINEDDKNIENPLGRTLVKPFIDISGPSRNVYYAADPKEYGGQTGFNSLVSDMFIDLQTEKEGKFKLHPRLSSQGRDVIKLNYGPKMIDQKIVNDLIKPASWGNGKSVSFYGHHDEYVNVKELRDVRLPNDTTFYLDGLKMISVINNLDTENYSRIANCPRLIEVTDINSEGSFTINSCDRLQTVSGIFIGYLFFEALKTSPNLNLIDVRARLIEFVDCNIPIVPQISPRLRKLVLKRCTLPNELPENLGSGNLHIVFEDTQEKDLPKIPENKNYTVEIR